MKTVSKKKINVLSILSSTILLGAWVFSIIYFKLNLLESIFVLLSIPSLLLVILTILKPFLIKSLHKLQGKTTSASLKKEIKEKRLKKGWIDYTNFAWNVEKINIIEPNLKAAKAFYYSPEGKRLRHQKKLDLHSKTNMIANRKNHFKN